MIGEGLESTADLEARWKALYQAVRQVREASEALAPRAMQALQTARFLRERSEAEGRRRVSELHDRLNYLEGELTGLQTAMRTRAVIEQAKGMVMLRDHCGEQQAFQTLVRASQNTHLKLRDVAQRVVEWGSGGSAADRSGEDGADVSEPAVGARREG